MSPKAPEPSAPKNGASGEPAVAGTFGKPAAGSRSPARGGAPVASRVAETTSVPSGFSSSTGPIAPKIATRHARPGRRGRRSPARPACRCRRSAAAPGVSSGTRAGQPARNGPPACSVAVGVHRVDAALRVEREVAEVDALRWQVRGAARNTFDLGREESGSPPYSSLVATTISGEPSPSRSPIAGEARHLRRASRAASTPGIGVAFPSPGRSSTLRADRRGAPGSPTPASRRRARRRGGRRARRARSRAAGSCPARRGRRASAPRRSRGSVSFSWSRFAGSGEGRVRRAPGSPARRAPWSSKT